MEHNSTHVIPEVSDSLVINRQVTEVNNTSNLVYVNNHQKMTEDYYIPLDNDEI